MADPTTTPAPNANNPLGQDIGSIISLIQGLMGSSNKNAAGLASMADPQAAARSQALGQLTSFESNPQAYLQDPIIQASMQTGLEGVSRQAGALGGANSGGRLAALQNYGQQTAFGDLSSRLSQLTNLAQIGNPVAAANFTANGQYQQSQNMAGGITGVASMLAQLLGLGGGPGGGGIVAALQKLFGGGGGSSDITPVGTAGSTSFNSPAGSPDLIPGMPGIDSSVTDLTGNVPSPIDFSNMDWSNIANWSL
jgi:hypothetical protein